MTTLLGAQNCTFDLETICARALVRTDHRLTLTSATPVTTGDVTAATNMYYGTQGEGNEMLLFNTSGGPVNAVLTEQTLALGTLTSSKLYDVFAWWNSGWTKEYVAWTDDTTRATALTLNSYGYLVKSGETYKRYIGTFRTTSTTTTEDSAGKRFLWNAQNRVWRPLRYLITSDANHTYGGNSVWRQWAGGTTHIVEFIRGISIDPVHLSCQGKADSATHTLQVRLGIGLGSNTTNSAHLNATTRLTTSDEWHSLFGVYDGDPGLGYRDMRLLQWTDANSGVGESVRFISHYVAGAEGPDTGLVGRIAA